MTKKKMNANFSFLTFYLKFLILVNKFLIMLRRSNYIKIVFIAFVGNFIEKIDFELNFVNLKIKL